MNTPPPPSTGYLKRRRARRLAALLGPCIDPPCTVLDIGCGDGLLDHLIQDARPGVRITGIDIARRPRTYIEVAVFDGARTPYPDGAFDTVMLVDVLHHCQDPLGLLREARRVCRGKLLIKDHQAARSLDHRVLRFMDWFGNARDGVPLPYRYWTRAEWDKAFRAAGLEVRRFEERLQLYPWGLRLLFDRRLHFLATLAPAAASAPGERP
jgi:SAM-dependent methyltransferase